MWAITSWPSVAGSLLAASAATPREADKQEVKVSSSTWTVVSGETVTPPLQPAPAPVKPGAVSFGQPSVIKPKYIGGDVSRSPFASWKSSNNPLSPVPQHLEAYIIQPTVKTCDNASTLSYAVLPLPLSEQNMQAQIRKLGPDYSIMDSLIDLHPQVLKLIQSQAVQRHGDLVSIQHGNPSSFTVSSGTLQTSPVIFLISTTPKTPLRLGSLTAPASVQETLSQQPLGQGPLTNVKLNSFGTKSDPFGTNAKASETKPGVVKAAPIPASAHHLASPEAYSKFLSEHRDETCTYVERPKGEGLQHYQTITANRNWHNIDRSLEEMRLFDYNAGRRFLPADTTSPPLSNNAWDTWRTSSGPSNVPIALDGRPAVPINNTAGPHFGTSIVPPSGPYTVYTNKSKSIFEHGNAWNASFSNNSPFTEVTPATTASTALPKLGIFGGSSAQTSTSPFQALASGPKIDSFATGPNTRSIFNASTPPTNNGTGSGQASAVDSSSFRLPTLFGEPSKTAALSSKPATGGLFSANALPNITSASKQPTFGIGGHAPAAQPAFSQPSAGSSFMSSGGPLFASALPSTRPASNPPTFSFGGVTSAAQPAAASSSKPAGGPIFASAFPSTRPASNQPTVSLGGTTSAAQPDTSQPAAQPGSPFTSVGPVTSTATRSPLPSGETATASGPAKSYSGAPSFDGNKALQGYRKVLQEQAKKAE